jgi:outer membrane protein OmpA-like peptidoglycan-associated protein
MSRTAKCSNYENCIIAYRNETVTLDDESEPVCPECGNPLKIVSGKGARSAKQKVLLIMLVFLLLPVAILAVGFWITFTRLSPSGDTEESITRPIGGGVVELEVESEVDEAPAETSTPAETPSPAETSTPVATREAMTGDSAPANLSQADDLVPEARKVPEAVSVPKSIDFDVQSAVNQRVKEEVLRRIDLMPTISPDEKDKLYVSVERARQMGRMITIPFDFGNKALTSEDISNLESAIKDSQIQAVLADPTAVFVILGYADTKGAPEKNLKISLDRADVVLSALKDLGVLNVMHSVGMGGSTMFDEKGLEKNRVVEVWAVLP